MTDTQQPRDDYPKWIIEKLRWLNYEHLTGEPRAICKLFCLAAYELVDRLVPYESDPDLTPAVDQLLISLQRIIDAKDAAIKVAVAIQIELGNIDPAEPVKSVQDSNTNKA